MRYERLEWDLSTACCDALLKRIEGPVPVGVGAEWLNLINELRARLQRHDPDPKCPKNAPTEDWLDT